MITIQQRLRELSKENFEALVHQLLLKKYPGAGIKKVDGTGGDQGIDSFSGDLSDGPSIWQCKHFPNRIRYAQKNQISASIETAVRFHKPSRWTLCLPIDLRSEEHKWFQTEIANKYKPAVIVSLMGASEILEELAYNRPLRDAFFEDNSISNALSLREIALGTEKATLEQKEQIAIEIAQQYLESNLELEPRLQPIMSVGLLCQPLNREAPKESVFSIRKGNITIDYVPRDPATYNRDPISLQITLSRAHSNNLQKSIDTGQPFKLPAGAILKIESKSPLLSQLFQNKDLGRMRSEMQPRIPAALAAKEFPMRLLAGSHPNSKELSYVPFKVKLAGKREVTLTSVSRLPIEVSIRLKTPPNRGATVSIRPLIPGADAVEMADVLEFLEILEGTGQLEVIGLDPPGRFLSQVGKSSNRIKIPAELRRAISDSAQISSFFGVRLRIPKAINQGDLYNIQILKLIATGEPLPNMTLSASLIKDSANVEAVIAFFRGGPVTVRMENPTGWQNIPLFGQKIDTGSISFIAEGVRVMDGEETLKEYLNATEGTEIDWKGECKGLCRFVPTETSGQTPGYWSIAEEQSTTDSK